MLEVEFEETGGALGVTFGHARLDAELAPEFRAVVGERARGRSLVVISLSRVRWMDASGLAALVCVLKRMEPGGELRLAGVGRPVRALLRATRLDEVFSLADEPAGVLSP